MFQSIIQLNEILDYSTFSLRAKILKKHIYYSIYAMFVELINPDTRLCSIDGTSLSSSKYDSKAKSGKGTRLGYYKCYKLYYITTVTDIIISLAFDLTKDSAEWFEIVSNLEFNLLTDINMRKAKRIQSFNDKLYENASFL